MKRLFLVFFCLVLSVSSAQELDTLQRTDSLYLEDQFYLGITYNLFLNKPTGVTQRNLSYGLQGGYIRDIPLNQRRNVALGIGLGYAVYSYYTNLVVRESDNELLYSALGSDIDYKRSKIENHVIEIPLEFRWRNSTPDDYRFWRIYTGVKFGYVFGSRSKFVSNEETISFTNKDSRNFQYGLTFNVGYNTFNIQAYYSLVTLFDDGIIIADGGENIVVRPLRIGIIFYIL